ncbi:MAG: hypothetical protein ACQESX_07920 [Bacteroidota bacterium]
MMCYQVQSFQDCKSDITACCPAFHTGLMLFIAAGDIDITNVETYKLTNVETY